MCGGGVEMHLTGHSHNDGRIMIFSAGKHMDRV